jgi:hypothetical protein
MPGMTGRIVVHGQALGREFKAQFFGDDVSEGHDAIFLFSPAGWA